MLISQSVAEAPQLCSPRSAQSIRERGGRCRTTLIDSSRLFPAIKLSWKINFCILCKLKICHSVPASRFVFCSVYCFRSPPPPPPHQPPLPVSIRLLVFLCLQLLFSLLTRLSSLVWIPSVSASSFLVSLVRRQTRGSLTKLAVVKMQLRRRNQ